MESLSLRKIRKTFILDTIRNSLDGAYHSMGQAIALLIIIKVFSLGDFYQTLINGGVFLGMIAALFYVWICAHVKLRASYLAAFPVMAGGVVFLLSLLPGDGRLVGFLLMLGLILPGMRIPIFSSIYAENYPEKQRGKLFGYSLQALLITTAFTAWLFGRLLDRSSGNYRAVLLISAAACMLSGLAVLGIPSKIATGKKTGNPFFNLSLIWKDPAFAYVLTTWFLMGFANLWSRPVRVAWLAESERGLGLSAAATSLILVMIPEITRLVFIPFWAWAYDKFNFIHLRIILNSIFGMGLLLFFLTENLYIIGFASFLTGFAFAGGSIAWNLWITRFAPVGKVNEYMSVHTFLTGIRGLLGPVAGFAMFNRYPVQFLGVCSLGLVLISSVMLWRLLKNSARFLPQRNPE